MPVNTAALKTFAPAMRRQLLEAVGRKLDLLLNSQTPDTLSTYAKPIAELREQEAENREQLLERVAYTWFNRLCALRYLDAKGWHPFGCKVLMPAAEGETQPELLKLMRAGSLPGELKPHTNETRLHGLLDGQIPPAMAGSDPQGEVYRELVLASCRSYHQLLPELFEGLDDASELLLPDDLLSEGSIAGGFRAAISEEDCEDVEIIGWLYQFYISEKKDQVIGKVVKSEDIPAATQLFTPNWIVKYMVQNSLGATWLATYPDSPLKGSMEFYIQPAEQTPEVEAQLAAITPESLDPESLTLIDPACGSGHILVEAYDLLKAIYLERGYRQRDIPELILTKNLYGLDICPRAAQLALFALLMKGRDDDRRLLERGISLNILALKDSTGLSVERLSSSLNLAASGVNRDDLQLLSELFAHATTFGSLIQVPACLVSKLRLLENLLEKSSQDLLTTRDSQLLRVLLRQASVLSRKFNAVVANPPWMGKGGLNSRIKDFANRNYELAKNDLCTCFIERGSSLSAPNGSISMVTIQSWMFLSSFEDMRRKLLASTTVSSMAHLASGVFSGFGTTAVVSKNAVVRGYVGTYTFVSRQDLGARAKPISFPVINNRYRLIDQCDFEELPGCPLAYFASSAVVSAFAQNASLEDHGLVRQGAATSDNARFLRIWHEVDYSRLGFGIKDLEEARESHLKWFPYNKGGGFRKWYGNHEFVINYQNDGKELKEFQSTLNQGWTVRLKSREYYFKESVSWPKISSPETFSARYYPSGFIFDVAGCCYFPEDVSLQKSVVALLNSNAVKVLLEVLSPTVNYEIEHVKRVPFVNASSQCAAYVEDLFELSERDWNRFEISWCFESCPLLAAGSGQQGTASAYAALTSIYSQDISRMKILEEQNNLLFINAYCLQGELSPDVSVDQVTLTINPAYRYGGSISEAEQVERFRRDTMAELLSYATGCMIGRYSLDQPGLILADSRDSQAAQLAAYEQKVGKILAEIQFKPDPDGIIPVLDSEWFEDDIVARTREFLSVTFPESSVAENLRFIEESLGKDIRKYFCSEFYKDHLQTYKKRPIYWMVQSPKKGFACLIYLHRYTKDTLNQVLNNYFRPYLQKLEARLAQLGLDQLNDDLPTRERTAARKEAEKITKVLKECQAWEQDALLPLAQQRIELDLDDGVKVNYLKLQDVLAPIPGLAAKED